MRANPSLTTALLSDGGPGPCGGPRPCSGPGPCGGPGPCAPPGTHFVPLLPRSLSLAHERSPFLSPPQDRHEFSQLVTAIRQQYNENAKQIERTWGGGIQGTKSQAATAKLERQRAGR